MFFATTMRQKPSLASGKGMNGTYTTVKELIDKLREYPEDAIIYHAETIDGKPQDMYLAVTEVFVQDGAVMLY